MANFFDQFDEPTPSPAPTGQANYFDQFDEPAPAQAPAVPQPYTPEQGAADAANMLGGILFPDQPAPPPQAAPTAPPAPITDAAKGLGSGIVTGTSELGLTPFSLGRLAVGANEWVGRHGSNLARQLFGYEPLTAEQYSHRFDNTPIAPITEGYGAFNDFLDRGRAGRESFLYKPQTTLGQYARTVGEFAPAVATGPGGSTREFLTRLFTEAAIPGVASEAAGQLTKGSPMEPWARAAGGLGGNLGTIAGQKYANAFETTVRNAAGNVTPQQLADAGDLMTRARDQGVTLTFPEAVQQVTGGGTKFGDLMRVVEYAPRGAQDLATTFAGRPQEINNAIDATLGLIGRPAQNPVGLGTQVQDAANTTLRQFERDRTRATRPLYQAAERQTVDPAAVEGVLQGLERARGLDQTGVSTGQINNAVDSLTRTPARPGNPGTPGTPAMPAFGGVDAQPAIPGTPATPDVPRVPVTDVGSLARWARDRNEANTPGMPGLGGATKEANFPVNQAVGAVENLIEGVPAYARAQEAFRDYSAAVNNPASAGPIGQLAGTNNTQEAFRKILPTNAGALAGGTPELVDAVNSIRGVQGGRFDAVGAPGDAGFQPGLIDTLVRTGLDTERNIANTVLTGGGQIPVGPRFAKAVAGTPQTRENLNAVVEALPNGGQAAPAVNDLMSILAATGQRKPMGSATSFNDMIANDLGDIPITSVANPAKLPGYALTKWNDRAKQIYLGRRVQQLSDLFLDPNAANLVQGILAESAEPYWRQGIGRAILQTNTDMNDGAR